MADTSDFDVELEAVQSVFMDDVSVRKEDHRTDIHYMKSDAPVVTLQLNGKACAGYNSLKMRPAFLSQLATQTRSPLL